MPGLVVLGVGGGIAAYKSCELLRLLTEAGHPVQVVPTEASLHFVGRTTWEALSGRPAPSSVFENSSDVAHVALGRAASLVLVAPATADLLARAAHGRADDLLTNVLLTARCPVVFAPAMHTEMWSHPATVANVATLRERGAVVLEPAVGRLTGADSGAGRLPEPASIAAVARRLLERGDAAPDLAGRTVVVSAGGTREYLDPVRFLGNRSSGRQGYALATTALARGAEVTVVAANVALPEPAGAKVVHVTSAAQMHEAVLAAAASADAVVMAAAVADFRPAAYSSDKLKKDDPALRETPAIPLEPTADVLADLGSQRRPGQVLVGFAAETATGEAAVALGRAKLQRKGADLVVVNEVGDGRGFEVVDNAAVIVAADGASTAVPLGPKEALADAVWDLVAARLPT